MKLSFELGELASTVNQQLTDTGIAGDYDMRMDYAPYNANDLLTRPIPLHRLSSRPCRSNQDSDWRPAKARLRSA
jgi:hypothetical protein